MNYFGNRPTIYIIGLVFFGGGVAFPQGQLLRLIRHLTRGDIFPPSPDHSTYECFCFFVLVNQIPVSN